MVVKVYPIEDCDVSGVESINSIEDVVEDAGMHSSIFGSPFSQELVYGADSKGGVIDPVRFIVKVIPTEEPQMAACISVIFPMDEAMDLDCEEDKYNNDTSALIEELTGVGADYMIDSGFEEWNTSIYQLR